MRDSMLIATIFGFIPTWYYFSFLENHGVWLAFHIFMITRALVLGWYFKRLYRANVFVPIHSQ
jgi:multidrug resistance protein, MATE family